MSSFNIFAVSVVSIWAEDVPKTVRFYRDVLGLQLHGDHTAYPAFAINPNVTLVVLQGKPVAAENRVPTDFPLFALEVDDLDAAIERLTTHGIELPRGVETHGTNGWVMFHDPAGNLIELVAHQPSPT